MGYSKNIHYRIYQAPKADFPEMVNELLSHLPKNEVILRLVFFGMPASNEQYLERRLLLREKIRRLYGDREPALSYVAQPPLGAGLILEIQSYSPGPNEHVTFNHHEGTPYALLDTPDFRMLFAGGFQEEILLFNIHSQAVGAFRKIGGLMRKEGFPINSIIRQWNYIERITDFDGPDQRYQMFNNARSEFYSTTRWDNGYPAATGIGADLGGLVIDLDAIVFKNNTARALPIDNKLQVAAHAYSEKVLEQAGKRKTTPKFERAKRLITSDGEVTYISGTAAIRGEASLANVGLEQQLRITMENIAELISDGTIKVLRVYLKEASFYEEAKHLLDNYQLNIPISYMCTDVCRDELLIEIEGIAIKSI